MLTDERYKSRKFKLTCWALVVLTFLFALGPVATFIAGMLGSSLVLDLLPASGYVALVPIILGIYSGANILDKNDIVTKEDKGSGSGGAPEEADVL